LKHGPLDSGLLGDEPSGTERESGDGESSNNDRETGLWTGHNAPYQLASSGTAQNWALG
jgi:hypothetical protein